MYVHLCVQMQVPVWDRAHVNASEQPCLLPYLFKTGSWTLLGVYVGLVGQ